jgi:hypothetical protein
MNIRLMKAIAAMTDMPKSARRVYGLHRIRYARWQAEQDKIFAGTHQRILDLEPFGGRSQLNTMYGASPERSGPGVVPGVAPASRARCAQLKARNGAGCMAARVPARSLRQDVRR